jgi:hypothetical protein
MGSTSVKIWHLEQVGRGADTTPRGEDVMLDIVSRCCQAGAPTLSVTGRSPWRSGDKLQLIRDTKVPFSIRRKFDKAMPRKGTANSRSE